MRVTLAIYILRRMGYSESEVETDAATLQLETSVTALELETDAAALNWRLPRLLSN
jgi:hypothetical protein